MADIWKTYREFPVLELTKEELAALWKEAGIEPVKDAYPVEILSEKQKRLVAYISGGYIGGPKLEFFLLSQFPLCNPKDMSWPDIVNLIIKLAIEKNIGSKEIEQAEVAIYDD